MPDTEFDERLAAVKGLLGLFKVERIFYIALSVVAVGVILFIAVRMIQNDAGTAELVGIFGSGGLIGIGIGRLLKMWTQALQLVAGQDVTH